MLKVSFIAERSPAALDRIRAHVLQTRLLTSRTPSAAGSDVVLKCENEQTTGSFKLRGAMNKLMTLTPKELEDGVVVASTGNHGAAVAHSCRLLGSHCTVVAPMDLSPVKEAAMMRLGARVEKHGDDGLKAEKFARSWAESDGLVYISPYNDLDVIIGQSTVAQEILDTVDSSWSIYVAVGGGGLISGMAAVLKQSYPGIRMVGCSPENDPVMDESVRTGRIVDLPLKPTLSDGTAGGIEQNAMTFPLCTELVDAWIRVSEEEIAEMMSALFRAHDLVVEGSAAVAAAALRKDDDVEPGNRLAVLCGGNVDETKLEEILGAT